MTCVYFDTRAHVRHEDLVREMGQSWEWGKRGPKRHFIRTALSLLSLVGSWNLLLLEAILG
jgi:hypothetical protein